MTAAVDVWSSAVHEGLRAWQVSAEHAAPRAAAQVGISVALAVYGDQVLAEYRAAAQADVHRLRLDCSRSQRGWARATCACGWGSSVKRFGAHGGLHAQRDYDRHVEHPIPTQRSSA